ncbi:MAG: methyltransferase domain-containing protein, partial [Synechococcaceae cyanobacterium]|nr:methyltransferase domain-containing protein [Synechococcaceae cyanobacterium]
RFRLMRQCTQALLRPGMALASLPCGAMDDLLSLDTTAIDGLRLSGIDLDPAALRLAQDNHARLNPALAVEFEQRDAWELGCRERWDLLTSNGLNIYVEDDDRCTAFYRGVCEALRPGGLFLISFITPPAQWRPHDAADLERQRQLFQEVVPVRWNACRSEDTTRAQLEQAGFELLSLHHDDQRMFPVAVARQRRTTCSGL